MSFLSDYGRADEFVGVCHAVMLDIAPDLRIVDVTHDVPRSTCAPARSRSCAIQYLPEGVVLAVVDPGVGTDRRCVAVEVENAVLVGPDNGLLARGGDARRPATRRRDHGAGISAPRPARRSPGAT